MASPTMLIAALVFAFTSIVVILFGRATTWWRAFAATFIGLSIMIIVGANAVQVSQVSEPLLLTIVLILASTGGSLLVGAVAALFYVGLRRLRYTHTPQADGDTNNDEGE